MWLDPPGGGCNIPTYLTTMLLLAVLALTNVACAEDESMGPVFVKEPPNRVDFSNGTGAVVECQARGNPQPDIIWVRADGSAVGDVPGLRQVLPNGNLVFPPFRAEDYRQEVHAQVYSCLARSPAGSVHSRDVNVRAVVSQFYVTEAENEYVIRANSAIMKCKIPSFVSEFVQVDQWVADDGTVYTGGEDYVVQQFYETRVIDEFVLRGNTATLKCLVPSFVADFVDVIEWLAVEDGSTYSANSQEEKDGKYLVLPSGELHIRDVGPEDGYKTYQCRTKHRLTGETRLSATKGRLVITEPAGRVSPKFPKSAKSDAFEVASGAVVSLLCDAQAFPAPAFRWYKFIEGSSRRQPVQLNERVRQVSGTLIIREARVEDSGKYLCIVNNSVGGESVETVLTVTAPLGAEIEPSTQTIDFGRPATFTCNVRGNPIKTVSWLKDGKPLGLEEAVLRIESVKKEDKGMYQCFVRNDQESAQATAELKLGGRFEPPQIRQAFAEETLQPGPSMFLKCVASGNPTPEITWELDGKRLSNTERLQVGQYVTVNGDVVSHLNISSTHTNDGGLYKCIAASKVGSAEHSARLNVYGLPFIRHMDKKAIVAGETLRVTCPVAGYPIESIVWERDTRVLPINRKQKVFPNGTLIIENVERMSDQATYTCVARNAQGYSARGTLEVQVMVGPQLAPFTFGDEAANAGEMATVQCAVIKGDLPVRIAWSLNGRRVEAGREHEIPDIVVTRSSKRISTLTIDSVAARHAGEYSCTATNEAGSATHVSVLSVNVPPRWILEPTDKAFAQGSDARVECKADGFPKPQVTWKKAAGDTPGDYTDLKLSNPDISVEDGTLSINNIQKTNEGYYLCEAVNGIGAGLSAVIFISVQAPPHFEIKLKNQTARRGEPAVLQCEAQGEKPIGILWNMNNKRLDPKSDSRYTIREEILANGVLSDLSIKRTERSDSALFTCVATNAFGSDDTSINMIVQEVPEVPYGLKVLDKSGRSVQLSWAAPYDGNSPIKRYVIEYKISKGSWETDIDRVLVPGSQQNVAGVFNLRPATTYHLRIVAENEIGASDPSDTVTIITAEEAPSGPPTSIRVDDLDQHTLKVTWKPPPREDWNGEILGYYVGYRLSSSEKPYMFETVDFSKEDGKEHHLQIMNLKTYTQYSVVVQAFNKVGSGPMSEERRQHTAEGVPEQPPHDTTCTTLTSQTIRISWMSPPLSAANGVITGYKVIYGPSDTWYDENTKDTKITSSSETILHGLKKYTNYSMQVLAFTSGGDGVKSAPIHCQTEQDAPEAPIAIKALVMSSESILVSWRPPSQPNGVITQYTVYTKADNAEEPTSQKVPPNQLTHEASELDKTRRYDFWVTASTNIGEGEASKIVALAPSVRVPAKIASFDDKFTATYKEDVKLPCLAVGVPAPEVTWKVRGAVLQSSDRLRQLPEGSLFIKEVDRTDAGEYSCYVENTFGHDTVTHQLIVHAPPHSPQITLTATTTNSLTMKVRPHPTDNAPIHGYTIHYKPEFGDWDTAQISSTVQKYTLENLLCGSRYQIYVTAYNGIGTGDPSDMLNTRTKGSKPIIPEAARFIEVATNSITLHLNAWSDGGCPMIYFVVEHKKKNQQEWNQVSNNVKPGGNFVVLDLVPATWYHLRVTAHNNAGFAVAEYEFATLTVTGGTIAPPVRNGDNDSTDVRRYFPWLPGWLDVNVVVPVGATIVVIIVGIVVICVALSRRTRGPEQTRLRGISSADEKYYEGQYDVVYQQTGVGGATLDKRRPDLRDELGYIAPPNRKLPPVPGSNYNTCDRIKRGTVISGTGSIRSHSTWDPRRHMYEELNHCAPNRRCPPPPRMGSAEGLSHRGMEDEICPYATFHLLGFREEMDPSKAMQFQTFPHPGNGHSGTMGPPVGHPTNASAHSRSGSQSMPRQNGRYSRVPSQGGGSGTHNVFSPEYDDPANCAPEEDQYGSQYGQYGAPYDHYGSRGSVGRRSVGSARNIPVSGSPEPPPPPPRNHDQNNSSFNDSKESNEISEAECDRDQLVNRNYGVNARGKDGMTTEEMRKLIERKPNEAPSRQTGSGHGGHGGLLTPYDTVAV
ncbi:Down syndrome cell adhesion molecule isoform X5 [Apis mellifera]|uniref:Down syndrome cell adhesion molecule isoform X5 n=1 Tax=Apis mellifera TaxID=7460 RepID=A0A7M7L2S3_APIME|nr:Down syndrome cell adhesion molecule isoform X5 [Apis mellifera]|eukprot:XP_026295684.1 Down syndrome cell adhesion molecule isoform X5 [Apis mellifera]